jgi:hypothetical protein
MDTNQIPGWGVDRKIADRPGYPLEQEFHVDHDTMQGDNGWRETIPLRGLSGVMRRFALAMPTHKPMRWMMLMMADRVDAFEAKLTPRNLLIAGGALGGIVAALGIFAKRKKLF